MRTVVVVAILFTIGSLVIVDANSTTIASSEASKITTDSSKTQTSSTAEITTKSAEPTTVPHEATTSTHAEITTADDTTSTKALKTTESPVTTNPTQSTTEHTPVPATTVAPPPKDVYAVKDESGNICIISKFEANFDIIYTKKDGKPSEYKLEVKNASVSDTSHCGTDIQALVLEFGNNTFTISFNKSTDIYVNELKLIYQVPNDAENPGELLTVNKSLNIFSVAANHSYKCDADIKKDLNANVSVHMKNVQMQAFRISKDYKFVNELECADDDLSDVIPIAVGCALAGLVIIVLIAYLVGRRRSHQKGYQSV